MLSRFLSSRFQRPTVGLTEQCGYCGTIVGRENEPSEHVHYCGIRMVLDVLLHLVGEVTAIAHTDHPAATRDVPLGWWVYENVKDLLYARYGIRTRVIGSKGRNDWPGYTNRAQLYIYADP
jgi:hypothetical protein